MPILNYTTTVSAEKTLNEIQSILRGKGATKLMIDNDEKTRQPVGLAFAIRIDGTMLHYRVPCRMAEVEAKMKADRKIPPRYKTPEQALRVGWRIVKDLIEAQFAIIDSGVISADEILLPYLIVPGGKTLYEDMRDNGYLLEDKQRGE